MVEPYSTDYNTVLEQAQQDQNAQARPELSTHVEDMEQYDTMLVPEAVLGEGLAISYSGGSGMPDDVAAWLEQNQIPVV